MKQHIILADHNSKSITILLPDGADINAKAEEIFTALGVADEDRAGVSLEDLSNDPQASEGVTQFKSGLADMAGHIRIIISK